MGIRLASILLAFIFYPLAGCASTPASVAPLPPDTIEYYHTPFVNPETRATLVAQFLSVRATFDPRTNLVILSGSPAAVRAAQQLLKHLELDFDDGPGAFRRVFIKHLYHARAADLAAILRNLADHKAFQVVPKALYEGPTRIAFDEQANLLIIETEPEYEEKIRALIDTLDLPAGNKPESQ